MERTTWFPQCIFHLFRPGYLRRCARCRLTRNKSGACTGGGDLRGQLEGRRWTGVKPKTTDGLLRGRQTGQGGTTVDGQAGDMGRDDGRGTANGPGLTRGGTTDEHEANFYIPPPSGTVRDDRQAWDSGRYDRWAGDLGRDDGQAKEPVRDGRTIDGPGTREQTTDAWTRVRGQQQTGPACCGL